MAKKAICETFLPRMIPIIRYIKLSKEERIQSVLPKPDCPLPRLMPSSAIEAANS